MEILSELKRRVIFLELETSMSQPIIWKDRADIQFMKLNLDELEAIFAMEGIIHFTGWDSVSTEQR